jgi:hypothetical protein
MDNYIVIKLTSGEEIVANLIQEDEYSVKVLFPMLVKYIPRMVQGRLAETITLAPFTYFASDDEFTFVKHYIIFQKQMNPKYLDAYNQAVDDFIAEPQIAGAPDPQRAEDIKALAEKLQNIFGKEDEFDDVDPILINTDSNTIH